MARTKSIPTHISDRDEFQYATEGSKLPSLYSSEGQYQSACHQLSSQDSLHCDIISLLAQTQIHNVDITPLTWLPHLESVGFGGTAEISQSLVNVHMSLAFKRMRPEQHVSLSNSVAYRALISEVCILGQSPIRDHPNILRLQGICFEAPLQETTVWPVLIFEKAKYSDLKAFMKTKRGAGMSFDERLDMLRQIASAIALLHHSNVIHGDIKPENILIYEKDGKLIPRVSDFGYSTIAASREGGNTIILPKSDPWNAPEHSFERMSFGSAQKMDVYSMALLCFWLLFHEEVSGSATLSTELPSDDLAEMSTWSWSNSIEAWKQADCMGRLFSMMMKRYYPITDDMKDSLHSCLSSMTTLNSEMRVPSLDQLLLVLGKGNAGDVTTSSHSDIPNLIEPHVHQDFEILKSLLFLADVNCRVRPHLYHALKNRYGSDCHLCSQNAAYQLALCHKIGFGSEANQTSAEEWLIKSGHSTEKFHDDIEFITHTQETKAHHNKGLSTLWNTGHLLLMDTTSQLKVEDLVQERTNCLNDIRNASIGLSPDHSFVFALRNSLVSVHVGLGELQEAYELCENLMNTLMQDERYGPSKAFTWTQVSALAAIQYLRGNYTEAAEIQRKVLNNLSLLKGEQDMFTLSAAADLSLTYHGQDNMEESRSLLLRVLDGVRSNLGEEHPSTLVIENDLASIFFRQGDLEEAENLFRRALSTKMTTLGIGNRSTLATLGNLALVTRYRGNLAEAETLNRQALRVREDILPAGHPDVLTNLGNLAAVLQARSKFQESEVLANKCLENTRKALGPDHPETFTSMHNLASILQDRGKFNDALALYQKARQCKEAHPSLGPTHVLTLDTISNMGVLYIELGMFAEARDCHQRVLDANSAQPGKNDSAAYFSAMRHLGTIYEKLGMYTEAEKLLSDACERQREVFGESLSTLATMHAYASVCMSLGRTEDALSLYHRVLNGREARLGPKHILVLDTVDALGELYCELGQYGEAEERGRRALNDRKELLGESHPDVFMSASNLSMVLAASADQDGNISGVPVEAKNLAEMALDGCKQELGPKHPSTIEVMRRMGTLKRQQRQFIDAKQIFQEAHSDLVTVLGADHPDCQLLLTDLESCMEERTA